MIALIRYNLDYYEKSFKYIVPLVVYVLFLAINYQITSPVWSTYFIAAIGTFVLAAFIGSGLTTCENITQQGITRLHLRNDVKFHLAKIISSLLIMIVICVLAVLFPVVTDFFTRSLTFYEILIALVTHLLFAIMGTAIGIFFIADSFHAYALVLLFSLMPLTEMFDGVWVVAVSFLLPPVYFLAEKMHYLGDDKFYPSYDLLFFFFYALAYSTVLIIIYLLKGRRKPK